MEYNYDDQSSAIPRGSKIRICLFLFLNIFANIACEDGLDNFLETVMDNFKPVAPTIPTPLMTPKTRLKIPELRIAKNEHAKKEK